MEEKIRKLTQDISEGWAGETALKELIQSLRKSDMEAVENLLPSDFDDYGKGSYDKYAINAMTNLIDELRSKLKEYREKNNI